MEFSKKKENYEFEMKKNNKEYHIRIINTNENIEIKIEYISGVQKMNFSNSFTMNEIVKMNHYFNICLSLKEIFEELTNLISKEKNSFIIDNNKMIFIIPTTVKVIKEIKFELNKEKKDEKSEIDNILEILNQQNQKIKDLETENNKNKKMIKELLLKINAFTENDINLRKYRKSKIKMFI